MKKIILCLFGVIPRSIKYTFNSIKENIIDPLKINNYNVEIYIFNLNIKDALIDGVKVDNNDINIIPYDYFEQYDQCELDKSIEEIKRHHNYNTFTRSDYADCTQNAFRQMYSEYRVGIFLENNINKYDLAIVCGPDFYIANKINLKEIADAFTNNCIYITAANEAQGYTNGFYFGIPSVLIKPLKRYEYINKYLPNPYDYEYILKRSVDDNNITRKFTSLLFFKIRANKNIFSRIDKLYLKYFSQNELDNVLLQLENIKNKLLE